LLPVAGAIDPFQKKRGKHFWFRCDPCVVAENLAEFHGKSEQFFLKKTLADSTDVDILAVFLRKAKGMAAQQKNNHVDSRRRL